jgi:hypothetical protein
MSYSDVEQLRASFRPSKVKVLFVGESAPAGGDFFYRGTGQVHREFQRVLSPIIGTNPSFLGAFMAAGMYLDDLVLEPVNWLSRSERKAMHANNVASLAGRVSEYRPLAVIAFMKAIRKPVEDAVTASGCDCAVHTVPFPGNGRQGEFRTEMAAILPKVLGLSS